MIIVRGHQQASQGAMLSASHVRPQLWQVDARSKDRKRSHGEVDVLGGTKRGVRFDPWEPGWPRPQTEGSVPSPFSLPPGQGPAPPCPRQRAVWCSSCKAHGAKGSITGSKQICVPSSGSQCPVQQPRLPSTSSPSLRGSLLQQEPQRISWGLFLEREGVGTIVLALRNRRLCEK